MDDFSAMSDEALVTAAITDDQAFAVLIDRYNPRLLRFILRISNVRREEGEDILQEAWISAYRNLKGFDTKLTFSSWMYRITRNQTISHFRKSSIRAHGNSVELDAILLNTLADDIDIHSEIDQQLLRQHLEQCLQELDEKYRTVIVLKYFEDKSYDEIADIIRKPAGTVATLLNRGKKKLAKIVASNPIDTV